MKKWAVMFFIGVGMLVPIGILEDVGGHANLTSALIGIALIFGIVGGLGYLAVLENSDE